MNALQPMTAAPSHHGAGFALVPANMREAMDLANVMAKAGFLARELQTPGGAMFVIEQAMRWNMSPFAVAMETSFIQGKPMFSGKIVAAATVSTGAVAGRLTYTYDGDGENRRVTVTGTLRGEAEPRSISVVVKDARTNNRVWNTQPDQQLAYHGARVWARRHAPEVMLGVWSPEEFDETPAEPRVVQSVVVTPERRVTREPEPASEPEFPWMTMDGKTLAFRPAMWRKALGKALATLESAEAIRSWRGERGGMFAEIYESGDEGAALVGEAEREIDLRLAEMAEAGEE